jgi:anti-sigma B factor antagonist
MNSASGQNGPLRLDGEMTIYRAAELKQALLAAIDGAASLALDLSGVTEIDSAGLQLLMLAKRTAQSKGGDLHLAAQSNAVADVLDLLDLATYFGDQLVIPARKDGAAERGAFNSSARHAHGS